MVDSEHDPEEVSGLTPRMALTPDLVALCRQLNESGARYLVVGGFAVIISGHPRTTEDIDLIIGTDLENEAKV